jgi:hypothetical protein
MVNMFQTWEQSALWKQILEHTAEADPERLLLHRAMPEIERVLRSGSTSPKDFTLHDEGHSFRVAQRMVEIIPSETLVRLSAAELALVLLSAYLHDIGMTPEWGKVAAIRNYLMEGSTDGLAEDEFDRLRQWLAVREGVDFAPPVTLQRMEELATYYCRAQHNEWSAEWIRAHIPAYRQALYPGWMEDLILICQSHHFGYEELAQPRFDPRDRGTNGVIHRRYLAAVLRVADVLENDPERTPEVILHHRSITQSSDLYWRKDHLLTEKFDQGRLTVSAYPENALLHKAVEETVDQIESELAVCHRLDREHPFAIHPVTGKPTLPHLWASTRM